MMHRAGGGRAVGDCDLYDRELTNLDRQLGEHDCDPGAGQCLVKQAARFELDGLPAERRRGTNQHA